MKEKKKTDKWLAAGLLFVLCAAVCLLIRKGSLQNYDIVCLGDSIIGNERGNTSITALLAGQTGKKVYNGAFGGTTMGRRDLENRGAAVSDHASMSEIVRAIVLKDFRVQNGNINRGFPMDYFPESMRGLGKVNWDKVKILVIEHGINDYLSGVPLSNPEDPYDEYTFAGALRSVLTQLKSAYPETEILLVTPSYCWFLHEKKTCEEVDYGYGVLEDYVNLELEIASKLDVMVLDNYHDSEIGKSGTFEEWEAYTMDGLHLNEAGRRLTAERIIQKLAESEAGDRKESLH